MDEKIQKYLNGYLDSLSVSERENFTSISADYFCADEINANICADLIREGEKTATCSLKYWYDTAGEPRPEAGHLLVVTDWPGNPTSIIQTLSVSEIRFCDVAEDLAIAEGEGDKSLDWWRKTHWDFFSAECKDLPIEPTEDMLLVVEHFKVVYKK